MRKCRKNDFTADIREAWFLMRMEMKRVAVLGASGWIGGCLARQLDALGCEVTGIGRSRPALLPQGVRHWQALDGLDLSGMNVVINLAGERIDQRWTQARMTAFRTSRVGVTGQVANHIAGLPPELRPDALVNASAVGIYGDRGDEWLDESSAPGAGYLAELCRDWELATLPALDAGVRVHPVRIGVVLGRGGPAFEKLHRLFRMGLGGRLGNGRQWMPWIHLHDLIAAMAALCADGWAAGPVNLVAPQPVTNREFTQRLAAACHRPALAPVPAVALRLAVGGFSSALLASQRVRPQRLEQHGFSFQYPDLDHALAELTHREARD